MTTYQLSRSDFNWKLTGANNFESVHNYVKDCFLSGFEEVFISGRYLLSAF